MKALLLLTLALSSLACHSVTAPSNPDAFYYPAELQTVIDRLDADIWIHPLIGERVGPWVRRLVRGIEIDASLSGGARYSANRRVIRWSPTETIPSKPLDNLASIVVHEARHAEGIKHSCADGIRDRTMAEGGAYAVQILWLERHGPHYWADWLRRDGIGC